MPRLNVHMRPLPDARSEHAPDEPATLPGGESDEVRRDGHHACAAAGIVKQMVIPHVARPWQPGAARGSASSTALFTSPRQQVPEGFMTSQEQRPARIPAVMRSGMVQLPVSAISRRTSAAEKPKQ